jgi:hypothetical protein
MWVSQKENKRVLASLNRPPSLLLLRLQRLVMRLFPTRLSFVDLLVLLLEAAALLFLRSHLLEQRLLAVFVGDAGAVELSGALDDGANLGKRGDVVARIVLFVVPLGIEYVAHLEELEIAA